MIEDIESIIARVKRPEKSVPLCLDGDLVAEYERLETTLVDAVPAASLGDDNSAEAIVEQMRVLHERMVERRAWFHFRGLDDRPWSDLKAQLPVQQPGQSKEDHEAEYHLWKCSLVSASCYEPVMSAEQADRLFRTLTDEQRDALFAAAWGVNVTRGKTIPFSETASAVTAAFAEKWKRRAPSASPVPSSSAGSSEQSPSTNTTTTDG